MPATKKKSGKVGHKRRLPRRKMGIYIPVTEQELIKAERCKGGPGSSYAAIAKKFKRCEETVKKVCESKDMVELAMAMRASLVNQISEKIVERLVTEVATPNSKDGTWVAMQTAEQLGILPPRTTRQVFAGRMDRTDTTVVAYEDQPEEVRVRNIVMELTDMAMECGKAYGVPLPSIDEALEKTPARVKNSSKEKELEDDV